MDDARLATILDGAIAFRLPLRRRFRGVDAREGVLVRGPSGWGEFAPFDDYSPAAASRWLDSAIESAFGAWPAPVRPVVAVNAIVPGVAADVAVGLAREAVLERGCRTVKVKVGDADLAADEARVAGVRDVLDTVLGRGQGAIRLDANAAWTLEQATRALRRLGEYDIEYVEQPCAAPDDLRRLRSSSGVRIAVDETIRTAAEPGDIHLADFADIAVLKAAPLGGAGAALRLAERLGVPVVVSGSLDSSVGLDAGLALAAALPGPELACGLGTGALLAADVVDETTVAVAGAIQVTRRAPDLGALLAARDRLDADRAQWWRDRLADAWRAGSASRMGDLVASGP